MDLTTIPSSNPDYYSENCEGLTKKKTPSNLVDAGWLLDAKNERRIWTTVFTDTA